MQALRLSEGEPVEACPQCGEHQWRRNWFGKGGRVPTFITGLLAFLFGPPWGESPYDFPEPKRKRFQCRNCRIRVLY